PVKGPCTGARVSARAGYPDLPRLVRPLAGQLAGHGGVAMVRHVALLSDGIDGSTESVHVEGDRVDLPPGRPFFMTDDPVGGEAEVISQGGAQPVPGGELDGRPGVARGAGVLGLDADG